MPNKPSLPSMGRLRRGHLKGRMSFCSPRLDSKANRVALEGIVPAARMAFELPPRLRLEQERRAEKQPKTSNSGSGPMKKGEGPFHAVRLSHGRECVAKWLMCGAYRSALDE